jgi:two-component system sensor histidine kinase YesM
MYFPKNTLKDHFLKILIPFFLFMTILLNFILSHIVANTIREMNRQILAQMELNFQNSIEEYFRSLDEICFQFLLHPRLPNVLKENFDLNNYYDYVYAKNEIDLLLKNATITKPYILDALIVNKDGKPLLQRNALFSFENIMSIDKELYDSIKYDEQVVNFSITYLNERGVSRKEKENPTILLTRKLTESASSKPLGFITLCMDFQKIERIFNINRIFSGQTFCIMDKNGVILYPQNMEPALEKNILKEDRSSNIMKYNIENSNLIIISYLPEIYLKTKISNIRKSITMFTILFSLIIIMIVYYISNRVTKPLLILAKKMDDFCSMDLINTYDDLNKITIYEVDKINSSFSLMTNRIRNLIENINIKNKEILSSEIAVLQAQINPHFMYHSLNTILWISKINKVDSISEIVNSLSRLLQISVYNDKQFISIQEEINYVKDYIQIENYRFSIPIIVNCNIQNDIKDAITAKLILQPIVENSIIHGFSNDSYDINDKNIDINCYKDESCLIIEVLDNGKSIDEDIANSIMEGNLKGRRFSGIGIKNVNDRIKLKFGDIYGVSIEPRLEKGTKVTIVQPLVFKEGENDKNTYSG